MKRSSFIFPFISMVIPWLFTLKTKNCNFLMAQELHKMKPLYGIKVCLVAMNLNKLQNNPDLCIVNSVCLSFFLSIFMHSKEDIF